MHLLVLSAFRLDMNLVKKLSEKSLNAPFGAQCFPTGRNRRVFNIPNRLNAPFGAQCFPTQNQATQQWEDGVSMHLLVLSAFRPINSSLMERSALRLNAPFGAQCFPTHRHGGNKTWPSVSMHLLVLSAFRQKCWRTLQRP